MSLTGERAAEFLGGDIEVRNRVKGTLFRGPIKEIAVRDGKLVVRLKWCAMNAGGLERPTRQWVLVEDLEELVFDLMFYQAAELADIGGISLAYSRIQETVFLIPSGGSLLDPARVQGLRQEGVS